MTLPRGTVIVPTFEDPPPSAWMRAGDERTFTFDLHDFLRSYWQAGRTYAASEYVRSKTVPGFAYQAGGSGGVSGPTEPPWPRTAGNTVTDGSITWTALAPGSNGIDPIATAVWSQVNPPDGALTIPASSNTVEEATGQVSGGTAGNIYLLQCLVTTTAGDQWRCKFALEIN